MITRFNMAFSDRERLSQEVAKTTRYGISKLQHHLKCLDFVLFGFETVTIEFGIPRSSSSISASKYLINR